MDSDPVDPEQINDFVLTLFKHATPGGNVSLRAFYEGANGEPPFKIETVKLAEKGGLARVVTQAVKMAVRAAGAERPVVVAPPIATFNGGKADARSLREGLALSVELDEHPQESLTKLRMILGNPTLVVRSGGRTAGGEDKLHVHYRLSEPTTDPDGHERLRLARAMTCDLVGGDATSKSPVHPIRWPGTLHRKNPALQRLTWTIEQHDEVELHLDEILAELTELTPELEGPRKANGEATGDAAKLMACAHRIANDTLSWADWCRLGMAFYRASKGSEEGFAAFDLFSRKWHGYSEEHTRERWAKFATSPPTGIGMGTLVYEARKVDPRLQAQAGGATTPPRLRRAPTGPARGPGGGPD